MTRHRMLIALFLLAAGTLGAWATNDTIGVTAGAGKLVNLIKFVSTNVMSEAGICDATTENQCASVSAGGAVKVDNSAVTQAVSQATAASLNATVVGTGTFAVQAASTLNAETTKVIGTVRNVGNAGAITDFAGQNAASPANSWLIGGQFNTSPTTITSGNVSPFQLDASGNLLVNVKAGGAGGGAVTVASGAVASGAYAAGSLAAGAGVDGWDLTQGAKADTAWVSGSGSVVSILKTISNGIQSLITSVQASIASGTNTIGNVFGAPNVTLTDCSGTIATGGTAQNAFAAQTTLHTFIIANIDTSEVLWFSLTGTATAGATGSYPLAPATATTFANLASFAAPLGMGTNHALSVVGATSTHKYSCTWS